MLTFYPIRDKSHMEAIHAFNQQTKIHQNWLQASKIHSGLLLKQLCTEPLFNCKLTPFSSLQNNTYNNFSKKCSLSTRGYLPEIRRKVTIWETVTGHTVYNSWDLSPQKLVHGDLSKELKYIVNAAISVVKKEIPDANLHSAVNVYVRYRGVVGREYIFDLKLNGSGGLVERRVSLLLAHPSNFTLRSYQDVQHISPTVNFIVPLNGLNRKKVAKFQRTFYMLCVRRTENCRLIYVIFSKSTTDISFMRNYLVRFKRRHTKFEYEYFVGDGDYEMTKAYNLGMSGLGNDALIFVAKPELSLADHFLSRCRANAARGSQIYYPEIFMYYNMPYVYRGKWHPRNYDHSRIHGRWATHAVACLHKSDYEAIGGYNTFKQMEVDPSLLQTPLLGKLEVMTAPDPGISHLYEATRCNSSLPPDQFSTCLSTQSYNLADRVSLAGYLLSLETKCGDKIK